MRAFGYVLLVLSLLGAGGAVYLGIQGWQGRQTIAAAGLRHLILLQGIPLGNRAGDPADMPTDAEAEIPFVTEGPGGAPTETVSPGVLKAYFQPAGGAAAPADGATTTATSLAASTPVPNQIAEVKRVYNLIKTALNALDGGAARTGPAAAWLLYQAETWEERLEIQALIAAGNGNELTHLLDLKFHRVAPKLVEAGPINPDAWANAEARIKDLEARRQKLDEEAAAANKEADDAGATNPAVAFAKRQEALTKQAQAQAVVIQIELRKPQPPRDEAELRSRLAHLLAHLELSAGWQKRVMMVVGLRRYVTTIASQAVRLADMAARVDKATTDDQSRFVEVYSQRRTLAIGRTQQMVVQAEVRARLAEQAQKDQDVVNQRDLQLTDLKAQLAKVKDEVNKLLAQQTQVEQTLFALEREVGLTLEAVYRMEAQLRRVQQERYGKK